MCILATGWACTIVALFFLGIGVITFFSDPTIRWSGRYVYGLVSVVIVGCGMGIGGIAWIIGCVCKTYERVVEEYSIV